jgi:large subunit ribosomal protein L25
MSSFELNAEPREAQGTGASRRLRHAGKVPAVLYGAGKDAVSIALDHDQVFHNLENEAFHSSVLTVKMAAGSESAILRDVQMHPYKPFVMHVDLQRVSATERMHIAVPLHFTGADIAPGVKLQGGIVSHLFTEVDVSCLPSQLPEYLEVDLSGLKLHESAHLSDIKLPEGVEITSLAHGGDDLAVASITAVRGSVEEEAEAEVVAETEGAGE